MLLSDFSEILSGTRYQAFHASIPVLSFEAESCTIPWRNSLEDANLKLGDRPRVKLSLNLSRPYVPFTGLDNQRPPQTRSRDNALKTKFEDGLVQPEMTQYLRKLGSMPVKITLRKPCKKHVLQLPLRLQKQNAQCAFWSVKF